MRGKARGLPTGADDDVKKNDATSAGRIARLEHDAAVGPALKRRRPVAGQGPTDALDRDGIQRSASSPGRPTERGVSRLLMTARSAKERNYNFSI